jgi:hypothetical protein
MGFKPSITSGILTRQHDESVSGTYDSNRVPVYYILADAANVSLLMGPVDTADECTMYQEIGMS